MLTLGIETSCDETAAAVVEDGIIIHSNIIASQEDLHQNLGGVIPEMASRRHIDVIDVVVAEALEKANVSLKEIDLIAYTETPGLIGALLVGINFAKGLALSQNKPCIGVNHVAAHLYAPNMQQEPLYPALGIVVSGGHTALMLMTSKSEAVCIGQTVDDAIGEAFDKVATLLSLPYPGGPNVEKLALNGDPQKYLFKCGHCKSNPLNFSFSGLKTAVLYLLKGQNSKIQSPLLIAEEEKKHVAASFQHAAFADIVKKGCNAAYEYKCKSIVVGGGVSQNQYFKKLLESKSPIPVFWPIPGLCLDNAAMIAGLGYQNFMSLASPN